MVSRKTPLVLCLIGLLAAPSVFGAQGDRAAELAKEMTSLSGTSWYGVYFGGKQKCGFAKIVIDKGKFKGHETYRVSMLLDVTIKMGAIEQKIATDQVRHYGLDGALAGLESSMRSVMGNVVIHGEVEDGKLKLTSTMAGRTTTREFPAPGESLVSALTGRRLVKAGKIGAQIEFEFFEPQMGKAFTVTSQLLRFEERVIGGVDTRIGVVKSTYKGLGMTSTEYVSTDGELLETVVGRIFTLRRESEKTAKDARVAFDALRAGIIPLKKPLGRPQNVVLLKLRLSGVPRTQLLIDDDRQRYQRGEEGPAAEHIVTLKMAEAPENPPKLPLKLGPKDNDVAKWLRPSNLAQSDAPEIIKLARQIVGGETQSYRAASRIQAWVFRNVRKKLVAALSNALDVLKHKEGDCSEHTILFVALCRAAGIPARQVVGIGYSPRMKGFGYHAWGEVYLGKWVAMDPTWGENLADATHVKFAVGDAESVGAVVGLFGSLKIEAIEFQRKGGQ